MSGRAYVYGETFAAESGVFNDRCNCSTDPLACVWWVVVQNRVIPSSVMKQRKRLGLK